MINQQTGKDHKAMIIKIRALGYNYEQTGLARFLFWDTFPQEGVVNYTKDTPEELKFTLKTQFAEHKYTFKKIN